MERFTVETADGTRVAGQVAGPAAAPPLLLLPGQANSHRWWDGLRDALEDDFRTVTFDYRGTGRTESAATAPWSTTLFAADAEAIVSALGYERVNVYGTSMGGRVAQMLAVRWPDRLSRLVLACTSPGGSVARERASDVRRALNQPDPIARRRALVELMYTPQWASAHGDRSTLLGDPRMSADAARRHLRLSAEHDATAELPGVAAPTLVLHGADDRMVPAENADALTSLIPGAEKIVTPRGRHGFFDEFATSVNRDLVAFLTA